jgi:hypothetical protein
MEIYFAGPKDQKHLVKIEAPATTAGSLMGDGELQLTLACQIARPLNIAGLDKYTIDGKTAGWDKIRVTVQHAGNATTI